MNCCIKILIISAQQLNGSEVFLTVETIEIKYVWFRHFISTAIREVYINVVAMIILSGKNAGGARMTVHAKDQGLTKTLIGHTVIKMKLKLQWICQNR